MARLDSGGAGGGEEEEEENQSSPRKPTGPGPDAGGSGTAEPDGADREETDAGDTEPQSPAGGGPTARTGGTGVAEPEPEPGTAPTPEPERTDRTEDIREQTARANQSTSLGTTGVGTAGTRRSRARERTLRANESPSLGTTGMGTAGTRQSRARDRTPRASQSASLGTTGVGTARTTRRQVARDRIEQQLREQGVDTDTVDIDLQRTDEGYTANVEPSDEEQFGDIDWSVGLGDPEEDEVETFVDETVGDRGSELVGRTISYPLRDIGEAAGESDVLAAGPGAVPTGLGGTLTGRGRTTADAAETYLNVTADAAETLPQAPAAGLELAELNRYVYGPALGGDVSESVDRSAAVAGMGGQLALQEGERAIRNPNRAVAEVGLGVVGGRVGTVAGRATRSGRVSNVAGAARQRVGTYTPDTDTFATATTRAREFVGDVRAQGQVPRSPEGDIERPRVEVEVDVEDIRSNQPDAGGLKSPQELRTEIREIRQRRAEFIRERSRRQSQDVDSDYTAPNRGGDYTAPEQDFRTVSGGPDTARSGPTAAQQRAFSESASPDRAVRLGPGEGIRARQLDTPTDDLRALDQASRNLADSPGASGRVAGASGAAGGVGVSVLDEIGVGEGTTSATQPATFSLDEDRTGVGVDRDTATDAAAAVGSLSAVASDVESPTVTAETVTETGTGVDSESIPATFQELGAGTGADTRTDTRADTRTRLDERGALRTGVDTRAATAAPAVSTPRGFGPGRTPPEGFTPQRDPEPTRPFGFGSPGFPGPRRGRDDRDGGGSDFDGDGSFGRVDQRDRRRPLVAGWVEETATDIATGGAAVNINPTQEQLRGEATADIAAGTLPTRQFYEEDTREEVRDAQTFLSFGTVGGDEEEPDDEALFDFGGGGKADGEDEFGGFFGGGS